MNIDQAKQLKYNDKIHVTYTYGKEGETPYSSVINGRFESYNRGWIYYSSPHSPSGQHAKVGIVEKGWKVE
jgi:hypothetical protein